MMDIVKSKVIVLDRTDIDTDLIIPAEFLTVTTKEGLGEHVFSRLRSMDKQFPFNLPEYRESRILVAGDNFGCGSSREHAAWALYDWGIRVIIAPSFADIFATNTMKNGILLISLPEEVVKSLKGEVFVDLPNQKVNGKYDFEIDPYIKECLIKGMDDLDYLLSNMEKIKDFDQKRKEKLFFDISKV